MATIAADLRRLLAADSRPRSQIAAAVGLHPVNLSQFQAGSRNLPLAKLERLAKVLGAQILVATKAK